jgi:hypothetical protein
MTPWPVLGRRPGLNDVPDSQAFASDALEAFFSAVLIVNAKRDAVGIAEIKLRQSTDSNASLYSAGTRLSCRA